MSFSLFKRKQQADSISMIAAEQEMARTFVLILGAFAFNLHCLGS